MISNRLKYSRCVIFRIVRHLCDKPIENENSTSDSQAHEGDKVKQSASAKLSYLLEQLNVESQSLAQDEKPGMRLVLNLSKPSLANRKLRRKMKKNDTEEVKENSSEKKDDFSESVKPELVSAVRSVAKSLGGDVEKTEFDLLKELKLHAQETADSKSELSSGGGASRIRDIISEMKFKSNTESDDAVSLQHADQPSQSQTESTNKEEIQLIESDLLQEMRAHMTGKNESDEHNVGKFGSKMSHLFLGVKIDRTKEPRLTHMHNKPPLENGLNGDMFGTKTSNLKMGRKSPKRSQPRDVMGERVDIFGSQPLNWFQLKGGRKPDVPHPSLETWNALQKHELNLLSSHPPANAFEEMITLTEQGKLWKFPIDNEQGLEEEAKVSFEEHVFLEHHLHGFPESGPVRQFMDLVTVGLSKNPYITVQRKIEHIDWFRSYFKEKEAVLRESGALLEEQCIT